MCEGIRLVIFFSGKTWAVRLKGNWLIRGTRNDTAAAIKAKEYYLNSSKSQEGGMKSEI